MNCLFANASLGGPISSWAMLTFSTNTIVGNTSSLLLADTVGNTILAVGLVVLVGSLVGLWFVSRIAPKGTALAIAVGIYFVSWLIEPGNARILHGLVALTRMFGFAGTVLGIVDLFKKRELTQPNRDLPALAIPQNIQCPKCKRQYPFREELTGKTVKCQCGESFAIASFAPSITPRPIAPPIQYEPGQSVAKKLANRTTPTVSVMLIGLFIVAIPAVAIIWKLAMPQVLLALGPRLPAEPYALDDATARVRVADGVVNATFPEQITFQPRPAQPGIVFATVTPEVDPGQPGYNSELRVYEPAGQHASKSLGCVLVGPAGGTLMVGPSPPTAAGELESLPYVKAGFAVVAFRQDGEIEREAAQADGATSKAATQFFAAQAGLVNARNALEFVLARMSEVDPKRIYVAGHSSAGTLALLFAEHESRISGCIAYAPIPDAEARFRQIVAVAQRSLPESMFRLFAKTSPSTHAAKLSCPLLLFHSAGDANVSVSGTQSFARQLLALGKNVKLVTVPSGDHYRSMLTQGIPAGIEWLEDLDRPDLTAEHKARRAEAAQAGQLDAAKRATESRATAETQALDTRLSFWLSSADSLATELAQVTAASAAEKPTIARLNSTIIILASKTRSLTPRLRLLKPVDGAAPNGQLSPQTRQKLVDVNRKLLDEKRRLEALNVRELQQSGLLSALQSGLLPAWFLEDRPATTEEVALEQKADEKRAAAPFAAAKRKRDYREDAKWAMRFSKSQDAVRLLRADFVAGDDGSIVEGMKWSAALKRPMPLLQWAFGAELNGFPATGPGNLQPKGGLPRVPQRNTGAEWTLSNQLKSLTGDAGKWLAQGLQNRVDSGSFGDWAQDTHRGFYDHPGIALLDFAPVEVMVEAARSQHADVLMAVELTMNRGDRATPNTTMVVRIHDVETGEQLWESKPITNTRILSARRQGKDLTADFAGTVLQFVDDEILLREVPKLPEETIEQRLEAISARAKSDPLSALVELRYFMLAKYLSAEDAESRMSKILGAENAKKLISTDADDRRAAIESLVPKGK